MANAQLATLRPQVNCTGTFGGRQAVHECEEIAAKAGADAFGVQLKFHGGKKTCVCATSDGTLNTLLIGAIRK
jgi:hypothetical protein